MPEKKTFTHIAVNNNYLICQDLGKNISKTSANGINMFCHIKESRGFFHYYVCLSNWENYQTCVLIAAGTFYIYKLLHQRFLNIYNKISQSDCYR